MEQCSTVIGISDHCSWAELVTVSVHDGVPVLRDRRQVELIAPGIPTMPYHHEGLVLPLCETEALVARVRASVADHCREHLAKLKSTFGAGAATVQRSPFPSLPASLADLLASRALTCAADGMLYRESLADAARELGMYVDRSARKANALSGAAHALGRTEANVSALLLGFGQQAGRPWTREHRDAAANALRVLAERGALR